MTNLQELIETAQRLSDHLEKAAEDEKTFCYEICRTLEKMSWEMLRASDDLKLIRDYN